MTSTAKRYVILAVSSIIVCSTAAMAEEAAKPTAALDVAVLDKYMWRGIDFSKGSIIVQPSLTLGYQGASLNFWGNFDSDKEAYDGAKYDETDITLSYAASFDMVSVSMSYAYYALDAAEDGQEIYGTVTLNTLLSPYVTVYRDIAHTPSWYVIAGINHGLPVGEKMTLNLGASVSYFHSDDESFTEADSSEKYRALHNGVISATLNIPINDYLTIKPNLAYSFPLSSEAEDYIESSSLAGDSQFIYGGVTLSVAF